MEAQEIKNNTMNKYKIELTEYQLKALSSVLNKQARLIFGQLDIAIEDECLEALVKHRHNGNYQDAYDDKEKLEDLLYQLKKLCWNQSKNASYGVRYSDYSDMLIDMHEVIRHELWKEDNERLNYTVDAYPAHHWNGNEPLIKVEKL